MEVETLELLRRREYQFYSTKNLKPGRVRWECYGTYKKQTIHLRTKSTSESFCRLAKAESRWQNFYTVRELKICPKCVELAKRLYPYQRSRLPFAIDSWTVIPGPMSGLGTIGPDLVIMFPQTTFYRYPDKAVYRGELVGFPKAFVQKYRSQWVYYERWIDGKWVHASRRKMG